MIPRVSVVMPTRDRRETMARALASIDAQSYRDFEVLVVDDGSRDGTAAWIRANRPDVNLVEMGQPGGAAAARNRGVERSRGEIVTFLDDDDFWHPSYLETQVAQLDAHQEADLCTTGHVEIGADGSISRPDLRPLYEYPGALVFLLAECPIHTLSVVGCRRAVFERIGTFDERLSIVHDLDWYLRLVAAGGKMEHCSTVLVDRAVPGGLVTRHRHWFREERVVHQRCFEDTGIEGRQQRRVRASRALFFARVGFGRRDRAFGLVRVAEAFFVSPIDAARTIALRLLRRRQLRAAQAWEAGTWETP